MGGRELEKRSKKKREEDKRLKEKKSYDIIKEEKKQRRKRGGEKAFLQVRGARVPASPLSLRYPFLFGRFYSIYV